VLVFTFPGQGSQRAAMGVPWAEHPSWELVGEASEIAGRDLSALLLDASLEELTPTANAQMATFVLSLVVLDAVERLGLAPAACAGHSLGEYTALTAAGAVAFEDGIRLVAARGAAMAGAGEDAPGTMAVLMGISDDDAQAACQRAEGDVWVANFNAPGQVVIAGTDEGVRRASAVAKELGCKRSRAIPVSGAFHTPLMSGARAALRKALDAVTFRAPEVAVVANVDAHVHDDPADWPGLLSAQLCGPVRWRQSVETLAGFGATVLLELGPGGVLSGLARRIAPELRALSVSEPADLDALVEAVTSGEDPPVHHPAGEHLYVSERLVVSPCAGIFTPESSVSAPGMGLIPGTDVEAGGSRPTGTADSVAIGDLMGRVGVTEVRTPFAGSVVRWLVQRGDRVKEGEPIAWLHRAPEDDG